MKAGSRPRKKFGHTIEIEIGGFGYRTYTNVYVQNFHAGFDELALE